MEAHARAAVGVLLLILIVGGCADGLSEEDYRAETDAVCIEGARLSTELLDRLPELPNLENYAEILPAQNQVNAAMLGQFEEIEPPGNLADQHEQLVENQRQIVGSGEATLAATEDGNLRAAEVFDRQRTALQAEGREIAAEMSLLACANRLPKEEQSALQTTIEDIWTDADPAHCTEDYTAEFVERQLRGPASCARGEQPAGEADSVEVSGISGTQGVFAEAQVVLHGGSNDGQRSTESFVYEDGRWKLDQLVIKN